MTLEVDYLISFHVNTRKDYGAEMLEKVVEKINTSDTKFCHTATDRFYTMIDNCLDIYKKNGHYLYGTIRRDRCTHHSPIKDDTTTLPVDGAFVSAYEKSECP